MRTEQIYYLSMIHKHSSINTAAESLNISPQALSLSMTALEDELGFAILQRTHSGSFLTSQGVELLSHGTVFLNALENMKNNRSLKFPALRNASLHLLSTSGAVETSFSSAISQFYLDYPKCKMQIERLNYSEIIEKLHTEADLGIIYHLTVNKVPITNFDNKNFEFIPLNSERYFCVAHSRFPIYNYKIVSLKTISNFPNIIYSPTLDVFEMLFKQYPSFHKNSIIVDDYAIYKQMIKNGAGLGIYAAADKNLFDSSSELRLIPIKEKIASSLGCLKRKNTNNSVYLDFIEYLCEYYQNTTNFKLKF